MKNKILPLLLVAGLFSSCIKKAIEDTQKQKVIDAVTKGAWYVSSFKQDTTDLTFYFSGFLFYFKEDGTVRAVKNTDTTNGSWVGDIASRTIASEFPSAPPPIFLLNGTWKIEDSYMNYIVASMSTQTGKNQLGLRQQ
ncbi:MAG TPA: hypothetical protein VLC28_09950 [Flavitalea sp.]|nr:hypothetical protein [Flavitalea sp.]